MHIVKELKTIHLEIPAEPDHDCDRTGRCSVCQRSIWRGYTVFKLGPDRVCPDCLECYLRERMETV